VLQQISPDRNIATAGYAWQKPNPNKFKNIGIKGLQSKILCKYHNEKLSSLDEEASFFVEQIFASTKSLANLSKEVSVDGDKLERWLLKTLISTSESGGLICAPLSSFHKDLLLGAAWPPGWGLYSRANSAPTVATPDLRIALHSHPITNELLAAEFLIAEAELWLLLHEPKNPETYGVSRPRGFIYKENSMVRTINLAWATGVRNLALSFTKIGVSHEFPPHMILAQEQINSKEDK
jgi:hypothetical protein